MKKTNRRPDGSEETLEGDPEELRKYEELQPDKQPGQPLTEAPKKPGILHGQEIDGVPVTEEEANNAVEWIRTLRKLTDKQTIVPQYPILPSPFDPYKQAKPWPSVPSDPIWVVSCPTCRRVGCQGGCWIDVQRPWYTLGALGTVMGATNRLKLN